MKEQPPQPDSARLADDDISDLEFDAALESGTVTFGYVVTANYARKTAPRHHKKYYGPLRQQYEKSCGGVRKIWFSRSAPRAVALTQRGELHVVGPGSDIAPELQELSDECERIHREAQRVCSATDKWRCAEEAFEAVTHILGYSKGPATTDEEEAAVRLLRRRVDSVRSTFLAAAQRAAQIRYFDGTLIGIVGIVLVTAGVAFAARSWIGEAILGPPALAAAAGGIGAWVSVLFRFSFDNIVLDSAADPNHLRRLGIFRPVIGAIVSLAVYSLVGSGILPIEVPAAAEQHLLFVAFVGFVSGFSERWAEDILVLGESQLRGLSAQDIRASGDPPEPAAGRARSDH